MELDSRVLEPDERPVLDELPRTQRGAPKIWESRLRELIGGDGKWVGYMEGRTSVLRATKSNFKTGKLSKPVGHEFDVEVVQLDHQADNMSTLFFRWLGPEKVLTEEEKQEAARERLTAMLAKLDKENPSNGGVADSPDGVLLADGDSPASDFPDDLEGDPEGEAVSLVDHPEEAPSVDPMFTESGLDDL